MYYRFRVDLENYQIREVPREIVEYTQDLERSLFSSIRQFAKQENLSVEKEIRTANQFLNKGWKLFVFRPKNQIKGWIWISPENTIQSWYVFKNYRNQGWGKELLFAALNTFESFFTIQLEHRDTEALKAFERVLEQICCRSTVLRFE